MCTKARGDSSAQCGVRGHGLVRLRQILGKQHGVQPFHTWTPTLWYILERCHDLCLAPSLDATVLVPLGLELEHTLAGARAADLPVAVIGWSNRK